MLLRSNIAFASAGSAGGIYHRHFRLSWQRAINRHHSGYLRAMAALRTSPEVSSLRASIPDARAKETKEEGKGKSNAREGAGIAPDAHRCSITPYATFTRCPCVALAVSKVNELRRASCVSQMGVAGVCFSGEKRRPPSAKLH